MDSIPTDKQAWVRGLVLQYQSPLIRYAQSIVRDEHIARDLVQETYLRLCKQTSEDLDGHEAAWLFRVCHNVAINRQRKEQRMKPGSPLIEASESASQTPDPIGLLSAAEDIDQVTQFIGELPENQQKVLRLKFYGGMKYREISDATGLTPTNVGFLLHKALSTLREKCVAVERTSVRFPQ